MFSYYRTKRYGAVPRVSGSGAYSVRRFSKDVKTLLGKKLSRALTGDAVALANTASGVLQNRMLAPTVSGSGAYMLNSTMARNNLVSGLRGSSNSVPRVSDLRDEQGAISIRHTEFITDIFGPLSDFSNLTFPLNPGMEKTFPWLSQVAQNFEEYEFKQLLFTYNSTITDIGSSTSGQCGTITFATDYNANNEPFADKAEMLAYAHSHSTKTTQNMIHGVECDARKNSGTARKYIRAYDLKDNADLKTYDLGLFEMGISNVPVGLQSQSLGELRVTYNVVLRKPKLFTSRGLGISKDFFVTPSGASGFATGTSTNPLNIDATYRIQSRIYRGVSNNLGCTLGPHNTDVTIGGAVPPTYPANNLWYRLYFPDGYSGCLKVTCIVKLVDAINNNSNVFQIPIFGIGNVTPIKEFYSQDGSPWPYFETQLLPNAGVTAAGTDFVKELCVYVRSAPISRSNFLIFERYNVGNNAAARVQTQWIIEEYNSYDKTRGTQINNVVDISSDIQFAGDII